MKQEEIEMYLLSAVINYLDAKIQYEHNRNATNLKLYELSLSLLKTKTAIIIKLKGKIEVTDNFYYILN